MLLAHETLPEVPLAPAPWVLQGRGAIVLVRLPEDVLDDAGCTPPPLRGKRHGRMAIAMWVDYEHSPVGPYRELLYIPGKFDFANGRHWSITRIYVSSMESVVNGRLNWGIPKDRCDFDFAYAGRDMDCSASLHGRPFAQTRFGGGLLKLPFTTGLLPGSLLRLSQLYRGRQFTYQPSASGAVRFAKVRDWRFDADLFPDLARGEPLAAVLTPRFTMRFPVSAVADAAGD